MTRDDLKDGMIIEERDGEKYIIDSQGKLRYKNGRGVYCYVDDYNYDLTYTGKNKKENMYTEWGDIVRVYDKNDNLLWDRYVEERKIAEMIVEHRGNPVQFIKDYLGIELTLYQEMMLKKILNEREE